MSEIVREIVRGGDVDVDMDMDKMDDGARDVRSPSERPRRRLAAALVMALLATAVSVVALAATPGPASAHHCGGYYDENGNYVLNPCSHQPGTTSPGGPGSTGGPGGTGGGGNNNEPPPCPDWRPLGGYDSVPAHIRPYSWDEAPEGSTFYYDACTSPNGFGPGSTTMWAGPGEPAPVPIPPTPQEVAEDLWAQIFETLDAPDLVTWPDEGDQAILDVPSFVAVTNWEAPIADSLCDTGVCVSLTATPRLQWDPGEPGADVVACAAGGTRFDPGGADPDDQASAPGACAYTYERRTGVRGRPEAWAGEVRVIWSVHWEETAGGASDDFEVTLSTELARQVDEVQTVVEGVD
jgi:hypothetical protein